MSADKLVFDLSQELEGSPQIFIKKDWLSILDNMNQNYSANQSIIDTSQLSNSNKYMNYREGYLAMPLLLTLTGPGFTLPVTGSGFASNGFAPASPSVTTGVSTTTAQPTACDYVMGLKNWFGTMIHSFTLDMNGTTIIQQTPFINMVNCFKLMTSLSWNDVITQGQAIGFYPDDPTSFLLGGVTASGDGSTLTGGAGNVATAIGVGVCNNTLFPASVPYSPATSAITAFADYDAGAGNIGLVRRMQMINLDPDAIIGGAGQPAGFNDGGTLVNFSQNGALLMSLLASSSAGTANPVPLTPSSTAQVNNTAGGISTTLRTLWVSHITSKVNGASGVAGASGLQISVMATIYLKHIHNFFAMCPLMKGTFFKMTMFLNQATTVVAVASSVYNPTTATLASTTRCGTYQLTSVSVPVGGVNPLMLSSKLAFGGGAFSLGVGSYTASIVVGAQTPSSQSTSCPGLAGGQLSRSIYLYVPAYTFNPTIETAYLSSPVKTIQYSDYYQYQVLSVGSGQQFNNLLTNGIANIKSVLIIPYYSASSTFGGQQSGLPAGLPVYQSPFDPAGAGQTSPMCLFSNFNVVISGQNAIYNTERYIFEHFNNQFKGCNSVNGDLTDGLTSGLIGALGFQTSQSFWYTNVGRQLPVEEAVPKSVQIVGTNNSAMALDLFCFIEYGVSVSIDALTGARV
jgi:hypothetical protein